MNNSFGFSIATTLIYTLICFIDMRFIKKEPVPFKIQIRNSLFVFISALLGVYLLKSIGGEGVETGGSPITAFTGAPGF